MAVTKLQPEMDSPNIVLVVLVFFLSGVLVYSTWTNARLIAAMNNEIEAIKEEQAKLQYKNVADDQDSPVNINTGFEDKVGPQDGDSDLLLRVARHAVESEDDEQQESASELLKNALSEIVQTELESIMNCTLPGHSQPTPAAAARQCSLQPGSKGDHGHTGPAGPQGDMGRQGRDGEKGEKGETGNIGYPGYRGEKGALGAVGLPGRVGPVGLAGPRGPIAVLQQSNCAWRYTDTCGHNCGTTPKTAVCPPGQYVSGFGIHTHNHYGRYHTRIYCCMVGT